MSNIKQAINLTWLVVVILESQSIALSQLANLLPGDTEAESRVTRIREWLKNPRVDVWGLYQVVLRHVLADWRTTDMTILSVIVDGTLVFGDRLQIFRLSLAHGNRAIPLAWTVVPGPGLVQVKRLRAMFVQVAEFLRIAASAIMTGQCCARNWAGATAFASCATFTFTCACAPAQPCGWTRSSPSSGARCV